MNHEGCGGGPLRRLHVRPNRLGRARGGALAHHLAAPTVPAAAARRHGRHEKGNAAADQQRQEAVAFLRGGIGVRARRLAAGRASLTGSLGARRSFSASGEGCSEVGAENGRGWTEVWLPIGFSATQVLLCVAWGLRILSGEGDPLMRASGSKRAPAYFVLD